MTGLMPLSNCSIGFQLHGKTVNEMIVSQSYLPQSQQLTEYYVSLAKDFFEFSSFYCNKSSSKGGVIKVFHSYLK